MGKLEPEREEVARVVERLLGDPIWERLSRDHRPEAVGEVRRLLERKIAPSEC